MHARWINGCLVFHADGKDYRLIDAIGDTVVKYCTHFASLPTDDTTGDPTEWTMTVVEAGGGGDSTAVLDGSASGNWLLTTDNAENDGLNLQLKGEAFVPAANKPLYFGCKFQINDATQTDILVGLCITDTTLLGGMTDGIYFECLDGATSISCVTEVGSAETQTDTVGTLADATDITLEFYAPDASSVKFFVNGTLVATHTAGITAEVLTPSIHFLTGEAVANTCKVDWLRAIQIN